MTIETAAPPTEREPQLRGQTVVVIGGSAGIGLETARRARAEGADVVLTGRDPDRLEQAATELGAVSTATFDADDSAALEAFFARLEGPIDHVMVTAGGPYYAPLAEMDFDEARRALQEHPMLMLGVARYAAGKVRPGGTLLFMGGTGARHPSHGVGISSAMTAALPALTASLALEIAPVRVNLIAAGFVDTPLSASLLGDELEERRNQLRTTLPIGRVVGPTDVAAWALHLMTNTALTGATYHVDGGQQQLSGGAPFSRRPLARPARRDTRDPPDWELSNPGLRGAWDSGDYPPSTAGTDRPGQSRPPPDSRCRPTTLKARRCRGGRRPTFITGKGSRGREDQGDIHVASVVGTNCLRPPVTCRGVGVRRAQVSTRCVGSVPDAPVRKRGCFTPPTNDDP